MFLAERYYKKEQGSTNMLRMLTQFSIIILVTLIGASPGLSYDQPWNGSKEDVTSPDSKKNDGDCPNGNCSPTTCGQTSSPVYTARGYLIWKDSDITFPAPTRVGLSRTYNSFDYRAGLFGRGWVTAQESGIARTYKAITEGNADGTPTTATEYESVPIWLSESGRRYQLEETETGCSTPEILTFTFEKLTEGGFKQVYEDSLSYKIYSNSGLLKEDYSDRDGTTIYYEYDEKNQLIRQFDSNEFELLFTYNDQGFVSKVTDHAERNWTYSYDQSGTLNQVSDPDGNTREYGYQLVDNVGYKQYLLTDINDNIDDSVLNVTWEEIKLYNKTSMRVTSYTEFDSLRHHYTYAQSTYNGTSTVRVDKTTRRDGAFDTIEQQQYQADYDTYWILSHTNNSRNTSVSRVYNARGKLIEKDEVRDGNAVSKTLREYNEAGRVIKTTEHAGADEERIITRTYFHNTDRVASINEYDIRETRYKYDTDLRVTKTTQVDLETDERRAVQYTYHPNTADNQGNIILGKVASIDGPLSGTSDTQSFVYNALGLLTKSNLPLGQSISYSYNSIGQLATVTDVNGVVTELTYDSQNRVIKSTRSNRVLEYSYSPQGQILQTIDELGRTTQFSYNEYDEPIKITYPSGDYATNEYVYNRDYTEITTRYFQSDDTLVRTSINRQDPVTGQKESQYLTNTSEKVNEVVYNSRGEIVESKLTGFFGSSPSAVSASRYTYDIDGQLTQVRDALNNSTYLSYDTFGNLIEVTDPNNAKTEYGYTTLGNLTQFDSPDTGLTTYQYDSAGNRTKQTNANNVITNYSYDVLNRLTSIDYEDDSLDTVMTYDGGTNGSGRLTSVTDGSGSSQYQYDDRGLVTQAQNTIAGVQLNVAYAYNDAGQLTQITYPSGAKVIYGYDAAGRLSGIKRTLNQTTSDIIKNVSWSGPNMNSFQHGNGLTTTLAYDASGRLVEKQYDGTDNGLQNQLDNQGQIYQQTLTTGGVNKASDFRYDYLGRLIQDGTGNLNFTYDGVGNRTSMLNTTNGERTDYVYDVQSNRLNKSGEDIILLDAVGNTLEDGLRQYQYNKMNRLSGVTNKLSGVQANYIYNYLGQRVRKQNTNGESLDVRFIYGLNGELLGEYDGSGNLKKEYIYQQNGLSEFIAQIESDQRIIYIHTDHLAIPRLATAVDKTVGWRWDSDAFGKGMVNRDVDGDGFFVVINHRFPGQYYDNESELHYNYFRYYDSHSGSYVTSDPIGLRGGVNTYLYAKGSPLNHVDPFGLDVYEKCRPANVAGGAVDHCWLETDTKSGGMGGDPNILPGQEYEGYGIPVTVNDHSNDVATKSTLINNIDEQCVNDELEFGKPIGRFLPPFNHCQSFVDSVIKKCSYDPKMKKFEQCIQSGLGMTYCKIFLSESTFYTDSFR